jgi:hypothetical protein
MGDQTTNTLEIEVSIKTNNPETGELMDALVTSAKLTKADAGKTAGDVSEEHFTITITPGLQSNYQDAIVATDLDYKLTKADAG